MRIRLKFLAIHAEGALAVNTIDPGPEFFQTFTPDVNGRLFSAIRRAYDTAFEFQAPAERGFNEQMFGFNLAGYCTYELTSEIETAGAPFRLASQGGTFRFFTGAFEMGCYRAGKSERDNIWTSFPQNDSGIQTLNNDQLWLPGMEPMALPKLVLAHFGNSEDGFCALYLCAPKRYENGSVVEWAFAHELWKRAEATTESAPVIASAPEAPAETVRTPIIRRKPRKDEEQGNG